MKPNHVVSATLAAAVLFLGCSKEAENKLVEGSGPSQDTVFEGVDLQALSQEAWKAASTLERAALTGGSSSAPENAVGEPCNPVTLTRTVSLNGRSSDLVVTTTQGPVTIGLSYSLRGTLKATDDCTGSNELLLEGTLTKTGNSVMTHTYTATGSTVTTKSVHKFPFTTQYQYVGENWTETDTRGTGTVSVYKNGVLVKTYSYPGSVNTYQFVADPGSLYILAPEQ